MNASIILPTYNEGGHIACLIQALRQQVPTCHEILVVDDASSDGTADVAEALRAPEVRVIRRKERGLVSAIQAGVDASQGDIVAWMDADFSHPPDIAAQLVALVNEGTCDAAIASRFLPGGGEQPGPNAAGKIALQQSASRFANQVLRRLVHPACSDWTSGFIAVTATRIKPMRLQGYYGDYFIRLLGELLAGRAVIREIPYVSPPRRSGTTKTATSWGHLGRLFYYYARAINQTARRLKRGARMAQKPGTSIR